HEVVVTGIRNRGYRKARSKSARWIDRSVGRCKRQSSKRLLVPPSSVRRNAKHLARAAVSFLPLLVSVNRLPQFMNGASSTDAKTGAPIPISLTTLWLQPRRSHALILFAGLGMLMIAFLTLALSGRAAVLVLDKPSTHFFYPFTIQNLMHIVFFVGLGDLFV